LEHFPDQSLMAVAGHLRMVSTKNATDEMYLYSLNGYRYLMILNKIQAFSWTINQGGIL